MSSIFNDSEALYFVNKINICLIALILNNFFSMAKFYCKTKFHFLDN